MVHNSQDSVLKYVSQFKKMRLALVKGYRAPHKVVLLLSVLYLVENGRITENKVYPDSALLDAFKQYWRTYIDNASRGTSVKLGEDFEISTNHVYPFQCTINNPFFYMSNEPFWRLVKSDAWEKRNAYSWSALQRCYKYAEIDQELFELLQDSAAREQLRNCLIEMLCGM